MKQPWVGSPKGDQIPKKMGLVGIGSTSIFPREIGRSRGQSLNFEPKVEKNQDILTLPDFSLKNRGFLGPSLTSHYAFRPITSNFESNSLDN